MNKRNRKDGKAMSIYIFPALLILLDVGAALVYFVGKDYKKAVYWLAAAVLNICVTFFRRQTMFEELKERLAEVAREFEKIIKETAERFNELAEILAECDGEIPERQKFKPCLRIGVLRPFLSDTRKLWQKNKALYLCLYMSKSLRHKNTKSRRASNELF